MKTIYPQEIANQFLTRYKQWEQGEMFDSIYTDEQMQAMMSTVMIDPGEMINFYITVQDIIVSTIAEERGIDNHMEMLKALDQYSKAIISLFVPVMSLVGATPEQRVQMQEEYEKVRSLNQAQKYNTTEPDFKLADIKGLIKDDDEPPVH